MAKLDKALCAMRVEKKDAARLAKRDAASTAGMKDKKEAREILEENAAKLVDWQYKLYAESKKGLLVVFQAMDTGGKDGVIRKVFGPLNAQGVQVTSFKRPTDVELAHGYLWRIAQCTPAKGAVRVFNRSHYEDVLVHKVHKLLPQAALDARYRQISDFERYLTENDIVVVKFFLHISKDEQKCRLQERLDDKDKRWKFDIRDLAERKLWGKYQEAYQAMLEKCSTKRAPWYVIPADHKWYRDWAVSSILLRVFEDINPKFPKEQQGLDKVVVE